MACSHDHHHTPPGDNPAYRRALYIALALNFTMFVVEIIFGVAGKSTSLKADALDFFGDSMTYIVTLFVLAAPLKVRAGTGLAKGLVMLAFGGFVLFEAISRYLGADGMPSAPTMGWVGFFALMANIASALVLMRHAEGDSNMRSVWLCTRNDAIANVFILIAAFFVWKLASPVPDLVAGGVIALLAFHSGWRVSRQALAELRHEH